jgi:nitrate/nitrite transport system substrate-binding protein
MEGYSAGEPWNARAVVDGIGFTAATSQDVWPDHPEKVLATTHEFTVRYPNTARALIMALLEASRFVDGASNHETVARIIARPRYVDTDVAVIAGRLRGEYNNGLGRRWQDAHGMKFHADGAVNYPYLSDGMWFMTQQRRWGLLKAVPDYRAIAENINQTALYTQAATAVGVALPSSPLRTSILMDGTRWSGEDPQLYAASFDIRAAPPAAHALP